MGQLWMESNQGFGKCQIHLSTEYPGLHILLMQFLPTILCVLSPRNFWKSKSPKPVTSGPLWAVKKTFSLAHKFRSRTEKFLDMATIPLSTQAFFWEPGASPCLLLLMAPRTCFYIRSMEKPLSCLCLPTAPGTKLCFFWTQAPVGCLWKCGLWQPPRQNWIL